MTTQSKTPEQIAKELTDRVTVVCMANAGCSVVDVAEAEIAELVRTIRKLTNDHAVWKLTHMGEDPPTGPLLRAAMDEATRRKITIEHPELS
jgi:hypothetical protein